MTACQMLASNACAELGYTGSPIAGTSYTDDHVAQVATEAMVRQRANYPIVCGASPRESKRRNRQLEKAATMDSRRILGIGVMAVIMGILGGPMGVLLVIIGAVISYLIDKELHQDFGSMFACAAMECD